MGDDELMVSSDPSEACLHRPVAFEDRCTVGESTVMEGRIGLCGDEGGEGVELLLHDVVVVVPISIGSNLIFRVGKNVSDGYFNLFLEIIPSLTL